MPLIILSQENIPIFYCFFSSQLLKPLGVPFLCFLTFCLSSLCTYLSSSLPQWISGSWSRWGNAFELQRHKRRGGMHSNLFHPETRICAEHTGAELSPELIRPNRIRAQLTTLQTICCVGLPHIHNVNTVHVHDFFMFMQASEVRIQIRLCVQSVKKTIRISTQCFY